VDGKPVVQRKTWVAVVKMDGGRHVPVQPCRELGESVLERVRHRAVSMVLTLAGPGVGALIGYGVVAVVLWAVSLVLALCVRLGVLAVALTVGLLLRQRDGRRKGDEESATYLQGRVERCRASDSQGGNERARRV
jgi:hypothetical protein